MRIHDLKIDPQPFADLVSGAKTSEVRNDDRGFEVGDTVRFPGGHCRTISHIQRGYGLPDGLCVLSYAQDSSAPEQEPVAWALRHRNGDKPLAFEFHGFIQNTKVEAEIAGRQHMGAPDVIPLYTHADPSDSERHRNDLMDKIVSLQTEIGAVRSRLEAATQRADAAERIAQHNANCVGELERKLGEAVGLLRKISARGLTPTLTEDELDQIDAFLSASAEPAEHDSDCSTNNRGVPELLGPCDCKGGAQ